MDKEQALKKAAHLCSRQEKCKADIWAKLKQWQVDELDGEAILHWLEHEKFIDENRFVHSFVNEKYTLNQWGRIKIRYGLQQKQIAETNIDEGLAAVDENKYIEILEKILLSKNRNLRAKDNYDRKAKLIRFACSRGFEMDLVQQKVDVLLQNMQAEN